jgi:NTP pyrophosphatase (non-canonical NTP hydrolase)
MYAQAILKWGLPFQYVKLAEESGELLQAAAKVLCNKWPKARLSEEVADVLIMLEQVQVAYGIESAVVKMKSKKLKRLERRLLKD